MDVSKEEKDGAEKGLHEQSKTGADALGECGAQDAAPNKAIGVEEQEKDQADEDVAAMEEDAEEKGEKESKPLESMPLQQIDELSSDLCKPRDSADGAAEDEKESLKMESVTGASKNVATVNLQALSGDLQDDTASQ